MTSHSAFTTEKRVGRFTARLLVLLLLLSFTHSAKSDAILSGLHAFRADTSGNTLAPTGGPYTSVPNTGNYVLWVAEGGLNAPLLNGPHRDDASISVVLTPGTYTFSIFNESGFNEGQGADFPGPIAPSEGLNLFFNGGIQTPGISVVAATNLSSVGPLPAFYANSGTTVNLPGTQNPSGAGTLTFVDGATQVTLTNFVYSVPMVYNLDRIGNFDAFPDGNRDYIGQFTLNVTTTPVPEPATVVLITFGLLGVLLYRSQRSTCRLEREQ